MFRKLSFEKLGLYKFFKAVKDKGTYMIEKLFGLQLTGRFADNGLKKFHPHEHLWIDFILNLEEEQILTLDNFLADNNNIDLSDRSDKFGF